MPTIKIVPMPGVSVPGPQGQPGPQGIPGPSGPAGQDALWNYRGEYDNGADYYPGDVVTFAGGTYYRTGEPNPGYYPTDPTYWDPIALPGAPAVFPSAVSWTPVLSGTGFAQTSNPATGTYLKYGSMVVVNLFVPFTNVTDFGTGQYSITLPFPALAHMDVFAGSIHNTGPTTDHYSLKGHLGAGSTTMSLWYVSGSSKDEPFKYNAPINLNTTDLFHMHFIYEIQE